MSKSEFFARGENMVMVSALDCYEGKRAGVFRRMTSLMRNELQGQNVKDLKLIENHYEIPSGDLYQFANGDQVITYSLFKRLRCHFGISIHEVLGEMVPEQCDMEYWKEEQEDKPILSADLLADCEAPDEEEQDDMEIENYIELRAIEELVWSD